MFYHLLYIHLFRPFLKYSPATSPLPAHVSPRKLCTAAASAISKLMRLYKRTYGLRQICNIAVYIVHSACTIHLLNLPTGSQTLNVTNAGKVPVGETVGKAARRDIVHGVKHLEEIAEDWLCARRTLSIISVLARKWKINLPEDAQLVLERTDHKYGTFSTKDVPSPVSVGKAPSLDGSTRSSPSPYTYLCPATNQQMPNPGDMTSMAEVLSSHPVSTIEVDSYGAQASTSWQPPPNPNIHPFTPYNTIPYTSAPSTPHGVAFNNHQFTQPQATPQQQQQLRQYLAYANPTTTKPTPMTNTVPSSILPRQLSPSTIFGQAEALAESNSQDWWLRDQAALAVGFENWGAGTPDMEVVDQGQGGLMMPTYFMPGDGSQGSQRGNGGVRMGGGLTAGLAASNSGSSPGSGMGGPGGGEWYG